MHQSSELRTVADTPRATAVHGAPQLAQEHGLCAMRELQCACKCCSKCALPEQTALALQARPPSQKRKHTNSHRLPAKERMNFKCGKAVFKRRQRAPRWPSLRSKSARRHKNEQSFKLVHIIT